MDTPDLTLCDGDVQISKHGEVELGDVRLGHIAYVNVPCVREAWERWLKDGN